MSRGAIFHWQDWAACTEVDPEIFFPEKGASRLEGKAKRVCAGCLVREDCLNYALKNSEEFGVWGGKAAHERQQADDIPAVAL